eukprot:gene143-biopygen269
MNNIPSIPPIRLPLRPNLWVTPSFGPLGMSDSSDSLCLSNDLDWDFREPEGVLFGSRVRAIAQLVPDGLTPQEHIVAGLQVSNPFSVSGRLPHFLEAAVSKLCFTPLDTAVSHRAQMLHHLENLCVDPLFVAFNKQWHSARNPIIESVNPDFNAGLFLYLVSLLNLPGVDLERDLREGFPYTGNFAPRGFWEAHEFSPPTLTPADLYASAPGRLSQCIRIVSNQEPWLRERTWAASQREISEGMLDGPYRARANDSHLPVLGGGNFGVNYMPRFGVPHNSEPGTCRPIDNGKMAKVNCVARPHERVWLPSPEVLVEIYLLFFRSHCAAHFGKVDHSRAYKRWPVRIVDQLISALVIWNEDANEPQVWVSKVLVFGCIGSVWGYCSISAYLCLFLTCVFGIPVVSYVDDFMHCDRSELSINGFQTILRLHELLGIRIKDDKSLFPCLEGPLLGLWLRLSVSEWRVFVSPSDTRRSRVGADLLAVLASGRLSPHHAKVLAGKISFVCGALWGRVGRAALRVLWSISTSSKPVILSKSDVISLRFLHALLLYCPPRALSAFPPLKPFRAVGWLDGAWEGSVGSLGGVLYVVCLRSGHVVQRRCFSGHVPESLSARWHQATGKLRQRSHAAECLAANAFLATYASVLSECSDLILFEDNTAAQAGLLNARTRSPIGAELITLFWAQALRLRLIVYTDRVASASNPADSVSRLDLGLASELSWQIDAMVIPVEVYTGDFLSFVTAASSQCGLSLAALSSRRPSGPVNGFVCRVLVRPRWVWGK